VIELEGQEVQLRQIITKLEANLADHEASIQVIQSKYQEAINDRGKMQREHNLAQTLVLSMEQRVELCQRENEKLKAEKLALENELAIARTALSSSIIPEVAELAKVQDLNRMIKAENERLEKKITSMQKDFEFTREAYQKASTSAVEVSNENSTLHTTIADLKQKVESNVIRLAEIQVTSERQEC
jgi:chromosome segregation ATPase